MQADSQNSLKEKLANELVIFDGAMGTELYGRGFFVNTAFDGLCLSSPDVIREIHRSYYEAGAQVMTTNTFGANGHHLGKFGMADQVKEINTAAVQLAREACEGNALIAGSVGPLGVGPREDAGAEDELVQLLKEQIAALKEAGADFIMFETLPSLRDIERAVKAIQGFPDMPYVVSMRVDWHGESSCGEPFTVLLQPLTDIEHLPVALGLNCGEGPASLLQALEILVRMVEYPIIVQPNAGLPKDVDGRTLFMSTPEYVTTYALRYIQLGARGVGGCCGCGPDHIRDMVRSVKPLSASEYKGRRKIEVEESRMKPEAPIEEKSAFGERLASGQWVTSIEVVPPRSYALETIIEKAKICRDAGIHAMNIPDGPRASARISPMVTAAMILKEVGIEPILHFCSRDKSLIGMQAELLGCAALGIRNILFITGDPPKLGDYPFSSGVFDTDSIGMVGYQNALNRGVDFGGKEIEPATKTLIGVGVDPNALDMEREVRRIREKVDAGANFIVSQPVFDPDALLRFLDQVQDIDAYFIAGIWPLASLRNAEFMKNEVPGVVVPDAVMERMAKHKTKDDQRAEGISIARESIAKIQDRIQGVQVSAPFGNVNTAISVIQG